MTKLTRQAPRVSNGAEPPRLEKLLTQADAAEYLSVSTRTIRSYVARGLLKAYRIRGSRLIRISATELEELVRPIPTAGSWTDD